MVFGIAPKSVGGDISRFGRRGGGIGRGWRLGCDGLAAVAGADIGVGTWARDVGGSNGPINSVAVGLGWEVIGSRGVRGRLAACC